jgi:PTH1 family peptidyl-tRNA hydrolase
MNLSGLACMEAIKLGYDFKRTIIIYDDKDLSLSLGRFRINGSAGGHNGLKSIFEQLKCHNVPRLRLGIGPFTRPLVDFVLEKWTRSEWDSVVSMDVFFNRFMELLYTTDSLDLLMNTINSAAFWQPDKKL